MRKSYFNALKLIKNSVDVDDIEDEKMRYKASLEGELSWSEENGKRRIILSQAVQECLKFPSVGSQKDREMQNIVEDKNNEKEELDSSEEEISKALGFLES